MQQVNKDSKSTLQRDYSCSRVARASVSKDPFNSAYALSSGPTNRSFVFESQESHTITPTDGYPYRGSLSELCGGRCPTDRIEHYLIRSVGVSDHAGLTCRSKFESVVF